MVVLGAGAEQFRIFFFDTDVSDFSDLNYVKVGLFSLTKLSKFCEIVNSAQKFQIFKRYLLVACAFSVHINVCNLVTEVIDWTFHIPGNSGKMPTYLL